MTRTTLKALWLGGGGILATWLAVSPNQGVPATSPATDIRRPASANEPTAEELHAQATRLRDRAAVTLRPTTRNPFRYASRGSAEPPRKVPNRGGQSEVVAPTVPAAPPPPALKLSGVALKAGQRIAIIFGDGQIYLVGEGDSVAGRYTVVKVDPEAVLLRDAMGAEQRLALPQ